MQVRVAGTVQGSLDNDCLHFVKFSSLVIHFSLSKILKTTFFLFGWQSLFELIKSEVSGIPSDFTEYVSCVFFAGDFLSTVCLERGRELKMLLLPPSFLACGMSKALLTVSSLSGQVWQLLASLTR